MILAKRLKWLREKNRYSQKEIAAEIGLSLNGYQKIEYGEREPKIEGLIKLAKFYDVTIDFLVGQDDHTTSLREKYMKLKHYDFNISYLAGVGNELIFDHRMDDEEMNKKRDFIVQMSRDTRERYYIVLREYINELVHVPEFNPHKNEITKDLFPIKYKITEEMSGVFIVRLFDKNGNDIASQYAPRIERIEEAEALAELRNSLVERFWVNGVPPEHGEYMTFLV